MKKMLSSPLRQSGFSLIEVLVVVGIIILLASISVSFLKGINKASALTYCTDEFVSAIQAARQRAATSGKNVAIRIYKTKGSTGQPEAYRAYQLWEQKDPTQDPSTNGTAWVAYGKKANFRPGIIAKESSTYSALLGVNTGTETISGVPTPFSVIIFTTAGRVDLPSDENFITFVEEIGGPSGSVAGLPANFATISIEPFNARPFLFRP